MVMRPTQPNFPTQVSVQTTEAADRLAAERFHRTIEERHAQVRNELDEGQDLILEYHTPAGEIIQINRFAQYKDVLLCQGHNPAGELCQILARPSGLHLMYRFVSLPTEEPQRTPIGFN